MQDDTAGTGALQPVPLALLQAVRDSFGPWFLSRLRTLAGGGTEDLESAADQAAAWVHTELAALLSRDVEEQRTNPLQLLRNASRFAEPVLRAAGVPEPVRDEFEQRAMPEDPYGIGPLAWMDLGEDVHEAGIIWGAWKAATVISRHRGERA